MSAITAYLTDVRANLATGDAREHAYRPALRDLLQALRSGLIAVNDPKQTEAGAVDFIVKHGEQPIGWLEAKDLGADLGRVEKTDQVKRYLGAYPNLILTDYISFKWYLGGKLRAEEKLGVVSDGKIVTRKEDQEAVEKLLTDFLSQEVCRTGKPEDLAKRMAFLARMAEDAILLALGQEGQQGQLHSQMAAFKETLLPDLTEGQFADMYAQTIAYGLFAAKCNHPLGNDFNRWNAAKYLPPTNPFLQRLFHELTGPDLDDTVVWVVEELVSLLKTADMAEIVAAFAKHRQGREDPVVHFYETFLKEYNPKERKIRGVYYTPEPVVSYIVRSVDHLLKTEFDKPLGLADPGVFILDPACGTGTFLYFVIEHIYKTITEQQGAGAWPGYVREHLLKRVFGFELLMAPYTIAHLKLGMLLKEQGYDFPDGQRLGVYLTNTLEEARARSETLMQRYITEESEAASEVKRDKPIMVVLGNPPYSKASANRGLWIESLMETYKVTVRAEETQIQALSDDYVKFMRFAHWRVERTGYGLVAMITNSGYLDGPLFRDMRHSLLTTFPSIKILNLHGDVRKRAEVPEGLADKNVFDIQQGVAIGIYSSRRSDTSPLYGDIWGTREDKYLQLDMREAATEAWFPVLAAAPFFQFTSNAAPAAETDTPGWPLLDVFGTGKRKDDAHNCYGAGFVTQQDQFAVSIDPETPIHNVEFLCSDGVSEADVRSRFRMCTTNQWDYTAALKDLCWRLKDLQTAPCLYRPFDFRFTIFNSHVCTIPRERITRQLQEPNLALLTTRRVTRLPFDNALVADLPVEYKAASHDRNTQVFPLYLYPEHGSYDADRRPNLNPAFVADLASRLGFTFIEDGQGDLQATFGPEDVFYYIYAVLHSPTYRSRYAEFLKIDFPRIPLTSNLDLFRRLCALGQELVALHLLKSPLLSQSPARYGELGDDVVEAVRYDEAKERVCINKKQYFSGISKALYEFQVGGYQVMNKWLKDRKGRKLSHEDVTHYQKVAAALTHTMRLMQEIDEAIPEWPLK